MSRIFRRRMTGALPAVTALALAGGVAATVAAYGGSGPASTYPTSGPGALAAPAAAVGTASPGADSVDPAQGPSATATALPQVTEKPPPVVDGVKRTNVGSDHSPQIQQQLSGSPAAGPPPSDAGALGVDVADYQHPNGAAIDWPQVAAAGYKFAFIKATEGDYYVNPYYASDLAQAQAAGLYATGYAFAVPNVSSGASQADYAVQNAGYTADGRTLPLALDIEYNPYGAECYGLSAAQMVSWLSAFTAEARRLTGQEPIIYTTADWWDTCTGGSAAFGSDPLWVAAYRSGSPPMPPGWADWTFWQYTSQGSVPGITGDVDISYFLRSALQLLDPGNQQDAPGTAIQLQVRSLNAAAGQSPDFTASNLPPGLSINGDGLISGTISSTASGTYGVTVNATYPSDGTGSVSFTWTVTSSASSHSASSSPSSSQSPSSSSSPSSSPSASPSSSASPSPSPSPSPSSSPSPSPSSSPSPSPSAPPASSPSSSPSASQSQSQSQSPSASSCPSPSPSPSPSASPSPSPSASSSPSASASPSPSTSPTGCP
jgi:GH25 family lysozyme M1 (1,4-beta-N-acetylmuramidase)